MSIISSSIGIDVAKDWLDVSVSGGKATRYTNSPEGCEQLAKSLPTPCVVHLEHSGGYERLVVRHLKAVGVEVQTHTPTRVKRMSQALVGKAKTDPLDAMNLARIGGMLPVPATKSTERVSLGDLSRSIEQLKKTAAEYLTRAKAPELDSLVREAYQKVIWQLKTQAQNLEKEFVQRVKASSLSDTYKLALSIKGVGNGLARVCTCEFPEDLKERTPAQICSYSGLAPIDNSSGHRKGNARLGKGNSRIKAALYMPALGAIQNQSWAKELYAKLRAKGNAHHQAIVAVMRRLLVRIVAVLKRGSSWEDEPPKS